MNAYSNQSNTRLYLVPLDLHDTVWNIVFKKDITSCVLLSLLHQPTDKVKTKPLWIPEADPLSDSPEFFPKLSTPTFDYCFIKMPPTMRRNRRISAIAG